VAQQDSLGGAPGARLPLVGPAIPKHFEPGPVQARPAPGPPTNLTGRAWAEILKPAKKFFGPSDRTWQPCLCPCLVHGLENIESNKVFQVKKEFQG
jgi:hypothetical protein